MTLANEIDDRTVREQLRDLNVEVIRPNNKTVTGVKWARKHKQRNPIVPHISITKTLLYVNVTAYKMLKPQNRKFSAGVGTYSGKQVLLLREDVGGYKFYDIRTKNTTYAASNSRSLLKQLADMGLQRGKYELVAINGGWMGLSMEGAEK